MKKLPRRAVTWTPEELNEGVVRLPWQTSKRRLYHHGYHSDQGDQQAEGENQPRGDKLQGLAAAEITQLVLPGLDPEAGCEHAASYLHQRQVIAAVGCAVFALCDSVGVIHCSIPW